MWLKFTEITGFCIGIPRCQSLASFSNVILAHLKYFNISEQNWRVYETDLGAQELDSWRIWGYNLAMLKLCIPNLELLLQHKFCEEMNLVLKKNNPPPRALFNKKIRYINIT